MARKVGLIILYFMSPVLLVWVIYTANPEKYSVLNFLIPMILGAAAYTWLNAELILSARPKFIERHFGLDRIYRFHGLMAIIAIILVYIHKIIEEKIMGKFQTGAIGDKAWLLFIAATLLALLLMTDTILLKIKPLFVFRKLMEKFKVAKHEYQVAIHNLTIIALILLLIHVLMTSSAQMNLWVKLVYILYFATGCGFYLYHKIIRGYVLRRNPYLITEIIPESRYIWAIKLRPQNDRIFHYQPGQFAYIRLLGEKIKPEEHPFTIASTPSNPGYLSFTIKQLGDFTANLKNVQKGCQAVIDAPYGKFSYLNYPNEDGMVLIAGGIGITPFLSFLRYMQTQDQNRKVILLWGINRRDDLIYHDEFAEIQRSMPNFVFIPVMFQDNSWEGEKGIVDQARIEAILAKYGFNLISSTYYVCGPSIFLEKVIKSLKRLGVKSKRIHFERFSF